MNLLTRFFRKDTGASAEARVWQQLADALNALDALGLAPLATGLIAALDDVDERYVLTRGGPDTVPLYGWVVRSAVAAAEHEPDLWTHLCELRWARVVGGRQWILEVVFPGETDPSDPGPGYFLFGPSCPRGTFITDADWLAAEFGANRFIAAYLDELGSTPTVRDGGEA